MSNKSSFDFDSATGTYSKPSLPATSRFRQHDNLHDLSASLALGTGRVTGVRTLHLVSNNMRNDASGVYTAMTNLTYTVPFINRKTGSASFSGCRHRP